METKNEWGNISYDEYRKKLMSCKLDNKEEIEFCITNKPYNLKDYKINEDLTVDVNGDVDIKNNYIGLHDHTIPFQFGKVSGNFDISNNDLISLKGCPIEVGGNFIAQDNRLLSIDYLPKKIGGELNIKGEDNNIDDPIINNILNEYWDDCNSDKLKEHLQAKENAINMANDFRAKIELLDKSKLDKIIAESKNSIRENKPEIKNNIIDFDPHAQNKEENTLNVAPIKQQKRMKL